MPATVAPMPTISTPRRSAARSRARSWLVLRLALAIVVSAVLLFPLYWMVVVAFSTRAELPDPARRGRRLVADDVHFDQRSVSLASGHR